MQQQVNVEPIKRPTAPDPQPQPLGEISFFKKISKLLVRKRHNEEDEFDKKFGLFFSKGF